MTTTNPLDALLSLRNGYDTARWNFRDAVGTPVSSPGGLGNSAALTFSFLTAVPSYFSTTGFAQFSEQEKQAARNVLAYIPNIVHLSFSEVSGIGEMTFGMDAQAGSSGYAYFPSFGYSSLNQTITNVHLANMAGDVWLNSNTAWTVSDFVPGGSGYGTLVHEVGHALGLKHPFFEGDSPGDYVLDDTLDSTQYTVMSYTEHPHSLYRTVTQTGPGSYSWRYEHIEPETFMPLDIIALQYLYGANTGFHSGNDTYSFDTSRPFIKTIWDGGGNDTISVANFSLGCVIDLREGYYSSISIPSDALPPGQTEGNPGIYDGTDNLAIAYDSIIENATGGTGNDRLNGNAVANVLDGGSGSDTMIGGDGSDTYVVDNSGDVVTETNAAAGIGGSDQVNSYLGGYTLGANIENGRILATGAASMTGNALNNTLYAGVGSNTLNGSAGIDTVSYLYAGVAVTVSLANTGVQVTGGSGSDTLLNIENLTGSSYNDRLTGNSGNNTLTGGLGNDTLAGGLGDDTYVINVTADIVTELSGQGTDLVQSAISYSLADTDGAGSNGGNVENLTLTGSAAINGTGNNLNNTLTGNGAVNMLAGGLGNDVYVVSSGDIVNESLSGGTDRIQSATSYSLIDTDGAGSNGGNVENLTLTGSAAINGTGNSLNNILTGNGAVNVLAGGLGNDVYVVSSGDIVNESLNGGTDRIQSAISYSLTDTDGAGSNGGNVENLTLTGSAAINGTGNNLNNTLTGNGAVNSLTGNAGADILSGAAGADRFIFLSINDSGLSSASRDTITDFNAAAGDKIDLSAIDANTGAGGNNAFASLRQGAGFSGSFANSASLYFDQTARICYGNNDADAQADFSILLSGVIGVTAGCFVL